jgi:hypothetical protein
MLTALPAPNARLPQESTVLCALGGGNIDRAQLKVLM